VPIAQSVAKETEGKSGNGTGSIKGELGRGLINFYSVVQ